MKKLHNEHLDWLEAESVYIIREAAAECRQMVCGIGLRLFVAEMPASRRCAI